ncbi:MAG: tetratricopeptide repeat protein, partial [Candidatus Fervidibacter sp.]
RWFLSEPRGFSRGEARILILEAWRLMKFLRTVRETVARESEQVLIKALQVWQWLQARATIWLWVLWGILLVGAEAGSALFIFRRQIGTILSPEIQDFLQVAANVSAGKGLKTFILRPIGLTPNFTADAVPDLYHPPLPTILWGAVFALVGKADERVSVMLTIILVGSTAVLLFFLTARLVNKWAALIAVTMLFAAPLSLSVSGTGNPIALSALLFMLWLFLLTHKVVWNKKFAFWSGAILGLNGLSNGLTLLAAPFALASRRWISWRERCWFVAAVLLVLLPYAWRNYKLTGIPITPWKSYAALLDTPVFPGDSIYRHTFEHRPSPIALTVQHAGIVFRKGLANLGRIDNIGSVFGWLLVLGAVTSVVWWVRWQGLLLRPLTAIALGTSASCLLVLMFTRPSPESLFFLLPPACLLTAANFYEIAAFTLSTKWWRLLTQPLLRRPYWVWVVGRAFPSASLGIALVAAQGLTGLNFIKRLVPIRWDPAMQALPLAESLMAARKGENLLASDEPRLLAFRWRRPIVWLPCHQKDWEQLKLADKVTHIWLSPNALLQPGGDADTMLRRTVLTGLPFMDRFYPTILRGPNFLMPTSFLIAGNPINNKQPDPLTNESIDKLLKQAVEHQQRGEYLQAEELLFAALQKQPSAQVFFQLGGVLLERKQYFLALQAFQAMLGELPGNFAGANNLAWTYLQLYEQLSRLPEPPPFLGVLLVSAERWAEHSLSVCPKNPEIRARVLDTAAWVDFLQGRTKAKRGQIRWRLKRALKRLEEAYRLLPENELVRQHLATVYTELGMPEKAEELLAKRK